MILHLSLVSNSNKNSTTSVFSIYHCDAKTRRRLGGIDSFQRIPTMIIRKHDYMWTNVSKREQEEHQLSNKIQNHRPLVILNCQGLQPPDPDKAEEVAGHQPVVPARNVAQLNQAQLQPVFGKVQLRNVLVIIICFLSLFGDIVKARGDIAQRHWLFRLLTHQPRVRILTIFLTIELLSVMFKEKIAA